MDRVLAIDAAGILVVFQEAYRQRDRELPNRALYVFSYEGKRELKDRESGYWKVWGEICVENPKYVDELFKLVYGTISKAESNGRIVYLSDEKPYDAFNRFLEKHGFLPIQPEDTDFFDSTEAAECIQQQNPELKVLVVYHAKDDWVSLR